VSRKQADHERRAELLRAPALGHADLELVHHVLRQVVALVDVEHVDAVGAKRREIRVDRLAAAQRADDDHGEPAARANATAAHESR
jgi:hypothetical protein